MTKQDDTITAFESDLKTLYDELQDDKFAQAVYAALCNMQWKSTARIGLDLYGCSWRYAGGLIAEIRDKGENYLDFYCSGDEGHVSKVVKKKLKALGWVPVPYEDREW